MALSDDHSVRRHVYEALQGPEHIRLMALHPALSKEAPLQIDFLSSSLKDLQGRYDAISYTWGEPILTFALHLDHGTQVCITRNLDRALRYLRYKHRDRLLWADAASINQNDNEEKAVQIPLMVKIFRGARRVMAWLDSGGDTTVEQQGMQAIHCLSRLSKTEKETWHDDFSPVLRFLNLPWFNRLWIVQEVVFSLDICLICGETELSFSRLVAALSDLDGKVPLDDPDDKARMEAVIEIGRLWDRYSLFGQRPDKLTSRRARAAAIDSSETTELIGLAGKFGLYGCTDPRDRLFALFSMATDIQPVEYSAQTDESAQTDDFCMLRDWLLEDCVISMNIDYSLDVRETYKTYALSCWKEKGMHLPMWEAVLSRQYSPLPADWPSWVPDWRVPPRATWLPCSLRPYHLPRLDMSRSATNILDMRLDFDALPFAATLKDLFVVKARTLRVARHGPTSLLSQLFQLYTLLQNPTRCFQRKHLVTEEPYTNILVDMIRELLPQYRHAEVMLELDQHLAKMVIASQGEDSQCNTSLPSASIQELVCELDKALEDKELFCFQDPRTQVYSVGCGNANLEIGDRLIVLRPLGLKPLLKNGCIMVLIVRVVEYVDDTCQPIFRLIGSGYLLDYWYVNLRSRLTRLFKGNNKTRAEEAAWKRFQYSRNSTALEKSLTLA